MKKLTIIILAIFTITINAVEAKNIKPVIVSSKDPVLTVGGEKGTIETKQNEFKDDSFLRQGVMVSPETPREADFEEPQATGLTPAVQLAPETPDTADFE